MKIFKLLLVFFLGCSTLHADINKDFYFGIALDKFEEAEQNRIKSVIARIIKEFESIFENRIYFTYITDEKKSFEDFKNKNKLNTLIIYSSAYLKNKAMIKPYAQNPFIFNERDTFSSYCLVAHNDSGIHSIKDLKDKKFIAFAGNENYKTWLDYLIKKEFNRSYKTIVEEVAFAQRDSTLVLDVYFKKADFTVVNKNTYNDMLALNPALEKRIHIVHESPKMFVYGLGLFHKDLPKAMVDVFNTMMIDGTFDKNFKELFGLLNRYGISQSDFHALEPLEAFYDAYEKM